MNHGSRRGLSAFRTRDFTIFWIGALLSNTGTWLQALAIPYVLFQLTGSALWVGLVSVAQFIPMVFLSPLGGSLADRHSRRTVLLTTQSAMAAAAVGLWAIWSLGAHTPVVLLVFLAAFGALNGINMPSWQAYVSDLVPRSELLSAVTLNSLQFNAARAIGPGIAGVVLAVLGPGWAFGINAISYLFVVTALLLVHTRTSRIPMAVTTGVMRQFTEAIRYTRSHSALVIVILVSAIVGVLGNPVFAFTVVFAGSVYHVGAIQLGLLNVCFGVGAVLAAPVVSGWRNSIPLSGLVRWGMLGYGLAIIVFGASASIQIGMVALIAIGACFLAVISGVNTALQLLVNDQYRGRVMALRLMIFTLAFPIGGLIQGALADLFGPQITVVGAGLMMVTAAIALGLTSGPYRLSHLDANHEAIPDAPAARA